ncbi:pentapeptide repeat-containing protein [Vibrio cyclitrophicus]
MVDCNLRDANFSDSQLLDLKLVRTSLEGVNLTDGVITGEICEALI